MKVFITGANGFLGQHLCKYLASKTNWTIYASGRGASKMPTNSKVQYVPLELTNAAEVEKTIAAIAPRVIIHTAAMSKPDECNQQQELCLLHNVTATENLVQAANVLGAYFLYTSTDFVFGEGGPHAEDVMPAPLNFYGQSKWMAEQLVQKHSLNWAIMRPVFIYGQYWEGMRPSFLHWVANHLTQGKKIKVVSDQQRTPTYVIDICRGMYAMVEQKVQGIFHLAGKDIVSPYEMAITVAKTLGLDEALIESVTSETFPEPVQRAKKSGLLIAKAEKMLAYAPVGFEEGVRLTFQ